MARTPKDTDFTATVEGVGTFTFARRTMADELKIQVEYSRIIDGVEPSGWLDVLANWMSTLRVMVVRSPDSWNMDELDPLESEDYGKLKRVFEALRDKENSFRRPKGAVGEAGSAPAV